VIRNCENCGIEYWATHSVTKYCSRKCMGKANSNSTELQCEYCGKKFSKPVSVLTHNPSKYCSKKCYGMAKRDRVDCECGVCGKKFIELPCHIARGGGKYCSHQCFGTAHSGENHYGWKPDLGENRSIRSIPEYKEWRNSVYARDNWTCQDCGGRGGILHAHHIFPFADFPEHRLEVWNGTTLCKSCHGKIHGRPTWVDETSQLSAPGVR